MTRDADAAGRTGNAALARHVAGLPEVAYRLGGEPGDWLIREVGDGNVNYVFVVRGPDGGVCVKQAPPYVRAVGEAWPLTPDRGYYEHRALVEHHKHVPARVPRPLHYDATRRLLVMEYLDDHILVRQALATGVPHRDFAAHMAEYLARSLFLTSDLAMPGPDKRALVSIFAGNASMCQIMETMVFTHPFTQHPRNRHTSPYMDREAERIRHDSGLKLAVSRLKLRYLTCSEALLHGDLHTGSVMVSPDDTRVIDQEFACCGPMGFDIGTLFAHLLMAHFAGRRRSGGVHRPADWALETLESIWLGFHDRFLDLWGSEALGDAYDAELYRDPGAAAVLADERNAYLKRVLADSLGFCGAEILRRVFGFARSAELEEIEDPASRADAESRAVLLARDLLLDGDRDREIGAVVDLARSL